MKKFWKLTNSVDSSGSTLILEGPISQESWWGDEVTPQAFRDELKKVTSKNLTVLINSGGGDVWAAVSIYDALKELDADVTVKVSGLAASAASVIAMAGDKITITPGSTMMVHRASMLAIGNATDLEKAIEMLETVESGIVSIYADRTGNSKEAVKEMLENETWMSAEKAVELGFADEVVKPASEADEEAVQNVFGGKFAFSMSATKQAVDSFLSKVKAQDESEGDEPADEPDPAEAPADDKPADDEEPETPATDDVSDENQDDDGAEDDAPADDTVDETAEQPKQPTNSTEVKEVTMSGKAKDIAKGQVLPQNQAPVVPKENPTDYLKTKQSVVDLTNVLFENAGKSYGDVKDAWADHLKDKGVTMGITNPEVLLPEPLIRSIEDAFEKGGQIWNLLNKTGLTAFPVTRDTVTGENSRAKGYNRSEEEEKAEELITLAKRTLRPQFIYKYITLPKEVIKENRDSGALLNYVLTELPNRIIREVERAVVIGDGRTPGSDYAIESFVSIKDDAADDIFATEYTPAVDENNYESMVRARALVKAEGAKYLVAKTDFLTDTLLQQGVNGGYLFQPGTDVANVMGFAGAITPDWMDEDADNDAYIFVPSAYVTVGDNSIESFTNFILKENKNEFLQEIWAGGGLAKLDAAVAIVSSGS